MASFNPLNRSAVSFLFKKFLIFFSLFLLLVRAAPAQEVLHIGGTGGVLAVMKLLGEKFERTHPGVRIRVMPSMGSNGGIKALLAGALDLGLSSRLLNNQEQGAVVREFARTPFVFATGKRCPVAGVRREEVVKIYSGAVTTWPDGSPIRLVLRPRSEYDISLLRSISAEMDSTITGALKREGMIVAVTDQDSADAIERLPGAFGTATLGQIISEKRAITPLALDGEEPTADVLKKSNYPYLKSFYLVHKPMPKPMVRAFIDFVYSEQGRAVLTRSGYLATGN